MEDLEGRVAVVTGGGEGIGRGIAHALAGAGARIAVADIDEAAARRVAEELAAAGGEARAWGVDVADPQALEALAADVERELDAATILCNNAGVLLEGPLAESTVDDWQWVLSVNVLGLVHGVRAFVPRMRATGRGGHIVNTASMAGLAPRVEGGYGVYSASKAAAVVYSEMLREELAPEGIGVSALCPSTVQTRIWQAARNRPAHLGPGAEIPTPARAAGSTEPMAVGEMVLRGIRENRAYIYTGDDAGPRIEERTRRVLADIEARTRTEQ